MAKTSLLLLYLDVFRPNVKLRYFIYLGMVFNVLFYSAATIVFFVFSMPKPGQSTLQILYSPNALKNNFMWVLITGVFNVGSDFYILCLPISGIWKLQLARNQKIGILGIFLTGLLWVFPVQWTIFINFNINSIQCLSFKCRQFVLANEALALFRCHVWLGLCANLGVSIPSQRHYIELILVSVVELCVGVICSCLLSFVGFFRYHLPLLRSIMSLFGSFGSKKRGLRLLNPFSQSGGHSPSKKLSTKDIKVTLSSRIDGKGHFLSTGSLFVKEDWQGKADSTTELDNATEGKETHRDYFERWNRDEDIENQPSRPQRIKTHSTQP